jgi:hypothetical protein
VLGKQVSFGPVDVDPRDREGSAGRRDTGELADVGAGVRPAAVMIAS